MFVLANFNLKNLNINILEGKKYYLICIKISPAFSKFFSPEKRAGKFD